MSLFSQVESGLEPSILGSRCLNFPTSGLSSQKVHIPYLPKDSSEGKEVRIYCGPSSKQEALWDWDWHCLSEVSREVGDLCVIMYL